MADDTQTRCSTCRRALEPITDGTGVYCPRCLTVIDHEGNPHGGLHQTGPNPWDYVYQPVEGQKVAFVDMDGKSFTGAITSFEKNEETGELRLAMGELDA